jgi:hypothetical protein
MTNLVSFGLKKPAADPKDLKGPKISDAEFEADLSRTFKKLFKGILQVRVRPIGKRNADGTIIQ